MWWDRLGKGPAAASRLARPSGPFSVGFCDYEWIPPASEQVKDAPSCVLARIYYPSLLAGHGEPSIEGEADPAWKGRSFWVPSAAYFPGYGYYIRLPWFVTSPLVRYAAGSVLIWGVEKAPVANCAAAAFPLLIFSHGLGGMRTTYSTVCTDLASHGYVVAAIEHRDGSASMSLLTKPSLVQQDESVLMYKHPPKDDADVHSFRSLQLRHRQLEVSATIDMLLCVQPSAVPPNIWPITSTRESCMLRSDLVEDPLSLIRSNIDPTKIGFVGHSFGAATGFYSSQKDDRISCLVAMDPWMYPLPLDFSHKHQQRSLPMLAINSETFHWPENLATLRQVLERNRELSCTPSMASLQCTLKGTGHLDQSDVNMVIPAWILNRFRQLGSASSLAALRLNNDLCLAFLQRCCRKDRSGESEASLWKEAEKILWDGQCEEVDGIRVDLRF